MIQRTWPAQLPDERSIAAYVEGQSSDEVDVGLIEEFFFDAHATLEEVPIADIIAGDADHNVADESKTSTYAELTASTRPPILLGFENEVMDGNHRLRVAISRGETHILAYVPADGRITASFAMEEDPFSGASSHNTGHLQPSNR
jgi:hypothetical protein